MSAPDRRSFLRGLATLPLIGGSVALIGRPTAAAVPVTDALHLRYLTWLAHEHRQAVREFNYRSALAAWRPHPKNYEPTAHAYAMRVLRDDGDVSGRGWVPEAPDIAALVTTSKPSTRAAVILSAAGVPIGAGDGAHLA